MSLAAGATQILIDGDYKKLRRVWAEAAPHLADQGPKTDKDAEIVLHISRTQAWNVPFRLRAYSHSWLSERSLPSQLPDNLRPKAERMYPRVAAAVGIVVKSTGSDDPLERELGLLVRGVMEDAVQEAFADGRTDPKFVRSRMLEARTDLRRRLLGNVKG